MEAEIECNCPDCYGGYVNKWVKEFKNLRSIGASDAYGRKRATQLVGEEWQFTNTVTVYVHFHLNETRGDFPVDFETSICGVCNLCGKVVVDNEVKIPLIKETENGDSVE